MIDCDKARENLALIYKLYHESPEWIQDLIVRILATCLN